MNKKRYLTPLMTVMNVEGEAMIASSIHDDGSKKASVTLDEEEEDGDAWNEGL